MYASSLYAYAVYVSSICAVKQMRETYKHMQNTSAECGIIRLRRKLENCSYLIVLLHKCWYILIISYFLYKDKHVRAIMYNSTQLFLALFCEPESDG